MKSIAMFVTIAIGLAAISFSTLSKAEGYFEVRCNWVMTSWSTVISKRNGSTASKSLHLMSPKGCYPSEFKGFDINQVKIKCPDNYRPLGEKQGGLISIASGVGAYEVRQLCHR
jgi:hypothetical protein